MKERQRVLLSLLSQRSHEDSFIKVNSSVNSSINHAHHSSATLQPAKGTICSSYRHLNVTFQYVAPVYPINFHAEEEAEAESLYEPLKV